MKIFGWMQNKLIARFGCNNLTSISVTHEQQQLEAITQQIPANEEFSDWRHGLLAIGTFGNTKDTVTEEANSKPRSIEENQELTVEEEENLQNELNSLAVEDDDDDDNKSSSVVVGGGKTINSVNHNNKNNNINRKSFSFILKKMLVCRAGFTTPTLNLRDEVPESTMEKMLRAILHKKIYPQNPNSTNSSTKKALQNKQKPTSAVTSEEEELKEDKADGGSKWVNTDSEYIVLEI